MIIQTIKTVTIIETLLLIILAILKISLIKMMNQLKMNYKKILHKWLYSQINNFKTYKNKTKICYKIFKNLNYIQNNN
jgi:hypothetical protein